MHIAGFARKQPKLYITIIESSYFFNISAAIMENSAGCLWAVCPFSAFSETHRNDVPVFPSEASREYSTPVPLLKLLVNPVIF